ncbi:MAG: VWA domain-containing protein [Planctomycetota bacterium]|nr:VWA domain-containing protein [Planctomycetota bacterium]
MFSVPSESSVRGPLTDWRSLALSAIIHAGMVILAGLIVMQVAPSVAGKPLESVRGLRGDISAIDTRAVAARVAGGSPGDDGGAGNVELPRMAKDTQFLAPSADPGEMILADALPAAKSSSPISTEAGAEAASGLGLIPGTGSGGGGGSGVGSGPADGPGVGYGTSFFGTEARARSFAFVIDRSGSMAFQDALTVAKNELIGSLRKLPPEARIAVIFYNHVPKRITVAGELNLAPATESNKAQVEKQLDLLAPEGGTDHMEALKIAMAMGPEVIFFLTDADLMTYSDVNKLLQDEVKVRIQTVHFSPGSDFSGASPLKKLAAGSGGSYRHVDINKFGKK